MKKVLSLAPQNHIDWMFRPPVWAKMLAQFKLWQHTESRHLTPDEVADQLHDCDAIITGWGAKRFSPELITAAPNLKIIVHIAGSPRGLFADETVRDLLIPRGISVYTGADGMGHNVAEATIGLMILATRRWPLHSLAFKEKERSGKSSIPIPTRDAQFLSGARVGLISASKVARQVIPLLHAFGCTVLIYDPYLSSEAAQQLGAERVGLDELFSTCDIVSLHAPDLPSTRGLVGAELLSKLRDGTTFINTSRGTVVDHEALLHECQSGRIFAALDVTHPEPLPPDSPFWDCSNVLLLPHIAGHGRAGYARIGEGALQALEDCFAGHPVVGAVPLDRWETVA